MNFNSFKEAAALVDLDVEGEMTFAAAPKFEANEHVIATDDHGHEHHGTVVSDDGVHVVVRQASGDHTYLQDKVRHDPAYAEHK